MCVSFRGSYFFFFQSVLFFLFVRHLSYYCDKLFSSLMLVVTLFVQFFVRLYIKVKFGEQWWRSGESTHLQPMCLNSYPVSTLWLEVVVGSLRCLEMFFLRHFGFLSTFSNSTRNQEDKVPVSGCG